MASVADWSQTPASNTSLGGISTDGTITLVKELDNMQRGMMAEVATSRDDGTIIAVYPRGYLHGLTLSNNAGDATNDIDIAAGEAVASDTPYWRMALASALTKRLDAAWAVGTGNGGLDTGSIANTTYHVWLIKRSDTSVVDALFSTSATAPTMPANYDRKRRIGSILRESGAIVGFLQRGDVFKRSSPSIDRNSASAFADAALTLSVPVGIAVQVLAQNAITLNGSSNISIGIGSGTSAAIEVNFSQAVSPAGVNTTDIVSIPSGIFTNTSAQVRYRVLLNTGTLVSNSFTTMGWIDDRGRSA